MSWKGKRVLITGAGGFLGSHLAERLVEVGCRTRAMIHYHALGTWGWLEGSPHADNMEIIAGDVRDSGFVRAAMKGVHTVFHLAARVSIPDSYRAPRSAFDTNAGGTLNILEAARDCHVKRVVITSTSEVYGTCISAPMSELHPIQTQSPYAASKIAADKLAEAFYRSYGLPVVTVRPFNAFGPRQSTRAIVSTIIAQCLAGNQVELGNLAPTRDLNYVDNTVDAFLLAGSVPGIEGQVFNVGSGREISIGDLVTMIAASMGKLVHTVPDGQRVRPSSSEVDRLVCDASKARAVLGWEPKVTLEDGLALTIAWMRENAGRYRNGYAI